MAIPKMLRELISRDMKRLAGTVYHARGTAYFEQGMVKLIDENDNDIIACVQVHMIMKSGYGTKTMS